ncbi:MAG TPA: nucleoside kinase [Thermotogota bacterium]|nr:nucleoside kinase [Thermotogota bacterium]HRW91855.1 nucleoside kinase [Thermotogota bacterium]
MIQLSIENTGEQFSVPKATQLDVVLDQSSYSPQLPVLGARVNNRLREMRSPVFIDSHVEFIDVTNPDGMRMVQRGLVFLLYIAAKEAFPERKLKVLHSLNNALYCELGDWVSENEIRILKEKMRVLVEGDLLFWKEKLDKIVAQRQFQHAGEWDKVKVFTYRKKSTINIYHCGDSPFTNYFYGYLPRSTGQLRIFDLQTYNQGFLLVHPTPEFPDRLPTYRPIPKFSQVFLQYQRWGEILKIESVGDLNERIAQGKIKEVIQIAEALHEKKIAMIAEEISRVSRTKLVLIAGPSSSGKTTTSKRLQLQMMANGLRPVAISMDDFFVERDQTPRDENGQFDFESIDAIDLDLFNRTLVQLLDGHEVEMPRFDFRLGKKVPSGHSFRVQKDQPIIVEGIHGLNERLTEKIPREVKFKIYVSALTQLSIDDVNRIPTTDTRMIRRIVRDHHSRGHSAIRTIQMWGSVRRGESRFIFPFQEDADVMFSSALSYELSILKLFAEPLLVMINEEDYENTEAKRLLKFLEYFLPITNIEDVPRNSILREFIGGSIFEY